MKICNSCGNLVSDNENSCQKCGNITNINYVNQNQQIPNQTIQQHPEFTDSQVMMNQQVMVNNQQVENYTQMTNTQNYQNYQNYQQDMNNQQVINQQQTNQNQMIENNNNNYQNQQSLIQFEKPIPQKNKKNINLADSLKKNYKVISVAMMLILVAVCTYLTVDNISLRKKVKLHAASAVEPSYKIQDNTNNSEEIVIEKDEEKYNFEIPEGTYPKVSQNYVFFVDEAYAATVMDQSGGLSLLNTQTGATGWVAVSRATLATYRDKKESLKTSYQNQGIIVTNIYDQTIQGKDTLVFEMVKDNLPVLLVISDASPGECYILTITNPNLQTTQDTTTANELMKMISITQKLT
jgi:hypothetical protein